MLCSIVKLAMPIKSVRIVDGCSGDAESSACNVNLASNRLMEDLKTQKNFYNELCRKLQNLADKLNQFYNQIFAQHNEEIARLSVEIARRVLMQKIQDGDYKIESIIKEILKNAPTHSDLIVRLNPKDLADCQKAQQEGNDELTGIKLVADANIGLAECMLESPKGIIKSLIDENLEQIAKALKKTE